MSRTRGMPATPNRVSCWFPESAAPVPPDAMALLAYLTAPWSLRVLLGRRWRLLPLASDVSEELTGVRR